MVIMAASMTEGKRGAGQVSESYILTQTVAGRGFKA